MREIWFDYRGWLRDERSYSPTTRYRYVLYAQGAHRWFQSEGHKGLLWATHEDLKRYLFSLSPNAGTRNDKRAGLIVFFDFAKARGYRTDRENPARALPRYKVPKRLPHPVEDEAVRRILAVAEASGTMTSALIHLFVYTGLRHAEARTLRWQDVDGRWLRIIGKGNKERSVPLPEEVHGVLTAWRSECVSVDWVFPSPRDPGRPLSSATLASLVRGVGEGAGVERLHPHKMRHTYATALLAACGDITLVQTALGHESPATTTIYAKVNPEGLLPAAERLPWKTPA